MKRPLLMPLGIWARLTGRSYWALRYADGRVLEEPDCEWFDAPEDGRVALRLYCPDGRGGELGNTADASGRLFQYKEASLRIALSGPGGRAVERHVVGLVEHLDGRCTTLAWNYAARQLIGPTPDRIVAGSLSGHIRLASSEAAVNLSPEIVGVH